ncbi:MAG: universal stress protein [Cyanomargarita calcarea GSE-NOS-MK-12-04C]|uniref:Universal stress protein n=1 Tax=Cyanomargarita calcarea GSE-NOS-MK-12-04C TaxID=2839659 RepID=A0A951QSL4_9CYAN|nr:universal stress protein [Cyanomargarita calcarea GSE-NOS-MK-12-04C]
MFHKMLVAIDDTDIGRHVFDEALYVAKKTGAVMMLLHVVSPFDDKYPNPVYIEPYSFYPTLHTEAVKNYMGQWELLKQEGIEFLRLLCDRAVSEGVTIEFTQNSGDPGRMICDVARNWEADLIMLGRRGRRGLSEFFLGSVSNYVLHHAPCSVLTVQGAIDVITETPQEAEVTVT